MDSRIVFIEGFFKGICPDPVEFTETFADKSIERRVGSFLGTTFNDHVDEFNLDRTDQSVFFFVYATKPKKEKVTDFLTLLQLNFKQLVHSFFVV